MQNASHGTKKTKTSVMLAPVRDKSVVLIFVALPTELLAFVNEAGLEPATDGLAGM